MDMAPPEKIHVDIASAEELQNVPGIGPKIAQAIIDIRDQNEGTISKLQLASIPHIRVSPDLWSMLTFEEDKIDSDVDVGGDDYEGDESDTNTIDKITSAINNADLMGPPPRITLNKAASVTSKKDVPPVCKPKAKSKIPVHMDPALNAGLGTCHMYATGPAAETLRKPAPDYFQYRQDGFWVGPKLEPPMPVYPPVNHGWGSGNGPQQQPVPMYPPVSHGWGSGNGQQQPVPNNFPGGQGHYPYPTGYGWPGMMPYMPPGYPPQTGGMPPPMQPYGWGQPYMYPPQQPAADVQQPATQGRQQYAPEIQEQNRRPAPMAEPERLDPPKLRNIPKSLIYDGKGNWQTFYSKYIKLSNMHRWSRTERRDQLRRCLEGEAIIYYSAVLKETMSFRDLITKMEHRFGTKNSPEKAVNVPETAVNLPETAVNLPEAAVAIVAPTSTKLGQHHQLLVYNTNRHPNHKIERMWPEVNQRVNYPIKAALVELVDSDQLDMDDELVKFCTSNLCIKLAEVGIEQVVNAWNAHRIPGRGIPNQLRCDSRAAPITADHLPSSEEAAELYKIDVGTSLTKQAVFGRDPFQTEEARQNCEAHFFRDTPDLKCVYSQAVNGQFQPLQEAILHLVDLTSRLS